MTYGWVQQGPFRSPAEQGTAAVSPERKGEKTRGRVHYELLIRPDGPMAAEIALFSDTLRDRWRSQGSDGPHILLATFQAWESMEPTLIRWIQRVCSDTTCFSLPLNNFGGIPPSTICLRINDSSRLTQLMAKLHVIEDYIDNGDGQPVNWNARPQLSLGGPLPVRDYPDAMRAYAGMEYSASLRVNRMVLKKTESSGQAHIVNIFPFHP
jgi:hypothetical protein